MTNNDVLRSIRYMLDLSEPKIVEILKLSDVLIERDDIRDFLRNEDDEHYLACTDEQIIAFLNGFIIFKRGRNANSAAIEVTPAEKMSNNLVLKKLRVAFELKEDTMHEVFANADYQISKPELSAFFRKKGHDNYRACGDQVLRYFLKGLTKRFRG